MYLSPRTQNQFFLILLCPQDEFAKRTKSRESLRTRTRTKGRKILLCRQVLFFLFFIYCLYFEL
jgi:hypothetical protein